MEHNTHCAPKPVDDLKEKLVLSPVVYALPFYNAATYTKTPIDCK